MARGRKNSQQRAAAEACPLEAPGCGQWPATLGLAAALAGLFIQPVFFALAGGLLATLSLILSPPGQRWWGVSALVAAGTVGWRALF